VQNATGEICGVYNRAGKLMAAGLFIVTLGRCLFLVCASTPEGKENQSMYLLVDHMIGKNAGSGIVFDFSGSNIPGIAYFNAGFGSYTTQYPVVRRNLLPWPLRLFKK
jgi:hypothetical protein